MVKRDQAWYQARKERVRQLFEQLRATGDTDLRDELISMHLDLVQYLTRRFFSRGEPAEDLMQVGFIGLIKAIDRYDLDRGVDFTTYATPTIVGELKRYFRDKGRVIRIPRRLQARDAELNQAVEELSQHFKRSPTVKELSDHLGLALDEVVEVLEASQASGYLSLDGGPSNAPDERGSTLLENLGLEDADLLATEDRTTISHLLSVLSERERQVVYMRFFESLTQIEIAERLHTSQMHVSRLLNRILEKLRQAANPGALGEESV